MRALPILLKMGADFKYLLRFQTCPHFKILFRFKRKSCTLNFFGDLKRVHVFNICLCFLKKIEIPKIRENVRISIFSRKCFIKFPRCFQISRRCYMLNRVALLYHINSFQWEWRAIRVFPRQVRSSIHCTITFFLDIL